MRTLVTGGAGFIGSHLVERLLGQGHQVRVLDDLSTGKRENLPGRDIDLVVGDLRSPVDVDRAVRGVEVVFHVGALPSVARSWEDPVQSLAINALGTSNVVESAIRAAVETVVYSSSSSVYGDQAAEVKTEDLEPHPISPYGHAKLMGEKLVLAHSAAGRIRGLALRYFNVFGPRQDPDSPYSAVIPLFIRHALAGTPATVHGDGLQSRDFTYVGNVVDANLLAAFGSAGSEVVNIACGGSYSLLDLIREIRRVSGLPLAVEHVGPRPGDIRHSLAGLERARRVLGYAPRVSFAEGLGMTWDWYRRAAAAGTN